MSELSLKPQVIVDNRNKEYLVIAIQVDGKNIVDFNYFSTDLECLDESFVNKGNHFILTCWCGIPECAGINRGILVEHLENEIIWNIVSPIEQKFIFDKSKYMDIFTSLKHELFNLKYSGADFEKLEITPEQNKLYIPKIMFNK